MSVINAVPLLAAAGGDYQISRSVRLRSSASAYFNRTPASSADRGIWTWSGWIKRGKLGTSSPLLTSYLGSTTYDNFYFDSNDTLRFVYVSSGVTYFDLATSAVFRDPSAWYHIVLRFDGSQSSGSRWKLYVNGVQQTFTGTDNTTASLINSNSATYQGYSQQAGTYFDGYLTEINFVAGQSLAPTSFGETDAVTGVWKPKKYAGTYGTNGFYLNFSDNSNNTAATIGKDYSGNGNNWTPNNISVTSGTTYDSMTDVPTLTSETAGNYSVLNPLDKHSSLPAPTNGNLDLSNASSAWFGIRSSIGVTAGKWYAEITQTGSNSFAGVMSGSSALTFASKTGSTGIYGFFNDGVGITGYPYSNGTSGTVFTIASGDIIGLAYDYDAQTVAIYRNGSLQATVTSVPKTETMFFCAAFAQTSATHSWNFGQRPFSQTVPTGFKALNTQNLPDSTIKKGNQYFDATTYTGNGSTQTITNSGAMQPDFAWIKSRSNALNSGVMDSVRGPTKLLISNATNAEQTLTDELTSFNANGFSLGASSNGYTNYNTYTYVGWQWKAGGTAVSNTDGSITSSVSANTTSGFSVVTYTGNGNASETVGHGLGVTPKMVIVKKRSTTSGWYFAHYALDNSYNYAYHMFLNTTAAKSGSNDPYFLGSGNTSSVINVLNYSGSNGGNESGTTYVAYCFADVPGFSKFGSYTGNGSADGPFVFCGFMPRFVMIKRTDSTGPWVLWDSAREPTNDGTTSILYPNYSDAEYAQAGGFDLLSNGFKLRASSNIVDYNASGGTYIYAAFAENPFKLALAR